VGVRKSGESSLDTLSARFFDSTGEKNGDSNEKQSDEQEDDGDRFGRGFDQQSDDKPHKGRSYTEQH
jgi:hypothetical protein